MKLLDYSFARPEPTTIKAAGYDGVLRYLSPNVGKNLTIPERDALRTEGLAIGLFWEWYAGRAKEGHDAGVQDAQAALAQANALGVPSTLPIFMAIDYDAPESDQPALNDYINGAKSVDIRFAAAYGGYWVIKRLFDAGIITSACQTYAWSGDGKGGTLWDSRAQLRQELNGQWNGQVDFDEDVAGTACLWTVDTPVVVTSAPTPLPVPDSGTHEYTIQKGDTFWGLEASNGWTHGTLQNLNPSVVATELAIGQQIIVPVSGTPASISAPSTGQYVVRSGDTFWGLEQANGWAHGTLQGLNPGVIATQLAVGETINIPSGVSTPSQHTYGKYTIQKGDTFWGLSASHTGWTVAILEEINPGVSPTALQIGEVINTP